MRVREVRISGFRAVPVGVEVHWPHGQRGRTAQMQWAKDAFCVTLPTAARPRRPMLSAIMGANSAGKSTILWALHTFFGPAVKLDDALFFGKRRDQPIVVEVTLTGRIAQAGAWHAANCTRRGEEWSLTVASVWRGDQRLRYVRRPDGVYARLTPRDRGECERLFPEWRVVWADRGLNQEANLERKSLLSDVVDAMLAQAADQDNVVARMARLVDELQELANRRGDGWAPIAELENKLTAGLVAVTPQPSQVRLQLAAGLPSLRTIFAQSLVSIDDGVDLALEQHGLGMQRSLVVSILHTWCDYIRRGDRDYLFAIEEPEIYLHPHATRVLLNLLEEMAGHDQVLFTTHANDFVNRVPLENVITVHRQLVGTELRSVVVQPKLDRLDAEVVAKVQRYLQEDRSDMLFARAVVLVEGQAEYFALPAFARTLGLPLDAAGVSVVFVNGIGNFGAYHALLDTLGIPHVVMMDGDGQQAVRRRTYAQVADAVFVLAQDFEHLVIQALPPARLLALMNECLARRGKPGRSGLGDPKRRAEELAGLGKPLVGRVAGEMLTVAEIAAMPELIQALETTLALARSGGKHAAR